LTRVLLVGLSLWGAGVEAVSQRTKAELLADIQYTILGGTTPEDPARRSFYAEFSVGEKIKWLSFFRMGWDASVFYDTSSKSHLGLNEYYLEFRARGWRFFLGKRRVSYSPSFFESPADVHLPPRNFFNPARARAGFSQIGIRFAPGDIVVEGYLVPTIKENINGIPKKAFTPLGAQGRFSALLFESDIQALYARKNEKNYFTLTFSRLLYKSFEMHTEMRLGQGSDIPLPHPNIPILIFRPNSTYYAWVLLGFRDDYEKGILRDFSWRLEYLYRGDGNTVTETRDVNSFISGVSRASGGSIFSSQESSITLLGRNYLFLLLQRSRIFEDHTASAFMLLNTEEPGGMFRMEWDWYYRQAVSLSFSFFRTFGKKDGEFRSRPLDGGFALTTKVDF